jgi:hypothetical protein
MKREKPVTAEWVGDGAERRDPGGTSSLPMVREPAVIVPSEIAARSLEIFDPFFGPNGRESENSEFDDEIWNRSIQVSM